MGGWVWSPSTETVRQLLLGLERWVGGLVDRIERRRVVGRSGWVGGWSQRRTLAHEPEEAHLPAAHENDAEEGEVVLGVLVAVPNPRALRVRAGRRLDMHWREWGWVGGWADEYTKGTKIRTVHPPTHPPTHHPPIHLPTCVGFIKSPPVCVTPASS